MKIEGFRFSWNMKERYIREIVKETKECTERKKK
jgi:hypothetical protein